MTRELNDKELAEFFDSIYNSEEIEMLTEMCVEVKLEHQGSEKVNGKEAGLAQASHYDRPEPVMEMPAYTGLPVVYNEDGEIDFEALENNKVSFLVTPE